jgi:hypothetical protein
VKTALASLLLSFAFASSAGASSLLSPVSCDAQGCGGATFSLLMQHDSTAGLTLTSWTSGIVLQAPWTNPVQPSIGSGGFSLLGGSFLPESGWYLGGEYCPPRNVGVAPEPTAALAFGAGLVAVAATRRRSR